MVAAAVAELSKAAASSRAVPQPEARLRQHLAGVCLDVSDQHLVRCVRYEPGAVAPKFDEAPGPSCRGARRPRHRAAPARPAPRAGPEACRFPVRGVAFAARARLLRCRGRHLVFGSARRDAGVGRRIGLRQDDHREAIVRCFAVWRAPTAGCCSTTAICSSLQGQDLVTARRQVQIIFQDPLLTSLNPRMRVSTCSKKG